MNRVKPWDDKNLANEALGLVCARHYMETYLIHIQYLGFRFHGWQHQPGLKTIESMIHKTLAYILGHHRFKILGTSRTDAMVSAGHTAFELFLDQPMDQETDQSIDRAALLSGLNQNLPPDIRALSVEHPGRKFNIISSPRTKTYHYYFCHGEKPHPFCAPFLASVQETLDISRMKAGARIFEGEHEFSRYCTRPGKKTQTRRTILVSRIEENRELTASFFPEKTWVYQVSSKGFMRNQVRLIMGQLIALGRGDTDLGRIRESLQGGLGQPFKEIAPASGLMLQAVAFDRGEGA